MRLSFLPIIVLSACTSIVPSTAMRLTTLSPMTIDPAALAVDVSLPDGIGIKPDTARLMISMTRSDTTETQSGAFELEHEGSTFRVARQDIAALRSLQATAQVWGLENEGGNNSSFRISLSPCLIGDGPSPDARFSVGLRLGQDGAFLPLVRNGPLSAVATVEQIRDMVACP